MEDLINCERKMIRLGSVDRDWLKDAADLFAQHGERAMFIAARQAHNCAAENDTPGFRQWAQIVSELSALMQVSQGSRQAS